MIKVAAFTGGLTSPSARFRVRQNINHLKSHNIETHEFYSTFGSYPPPQRWSRGLWGAGELLSRVPHIIGSFQHDVVLLQRTIISGYKTLEPFTKKPRVLDIDDAIFLYRKNGEFIKNIAQSCDSIVCGNSYLADWFAKYNSNIHIIHTGIDTEKYTPIEKKESQESIYLGWIGTSSNFRYLYNIENSLSQILNNQKKIKLKIISDSEPKFKKINPDSIIFKKWSEKIEMNEIQSFDIGIMPLENSEWARGKCSFKMIQYMSCGIPVIASPVGMNRDVLNMGGFGVPAITKEDWIDGIKLLAKSTATRKEYGEVARNIAKSNFSTTLISKQLSTVITSVK